MFRGGVSKVDGRAALPKRGPKTGTRAFRSQPHTSEMDDVENFIRAMAELGVFVVLKLTSYRVCFHGF